MQQTTDAPLCKGSTPPGHIVRPHLSDGTPGDWDNKPVIPRIPNPRKPTRAAADPLPQREPGKTLRRPPATVGRPKPVPQRSMAVAR